MVYTQVMDFMQLFLFVLDELVDRSNISRTFQVGRVIYDCAACHVLKSLIYTSN